MSLGDEIITRDEPDVPPQPGSVESNAQKLVEVIDRRIQVFLDGFEDRLATAMQKALDTVVSSEEDRLRALEEDMAKVMRHLGLDARGPANPEARDGVEL